MRIVETDNFGGDYPNESFLNLPNLSIEHATEICKAINNGFSGNHHRYWKVVDNDYELQPGFQP